MSSAGSTRFTLPSSRPAKGALSVPLSQGPLDRSIAGTLGVMRAAIFHEARRIEPGDRPDPSLVAPTDAIVRVVIACVCGSDLWYYRGETPFEPGGPIGHEFVGVVEEVGSDVGAIANGDLVIAPFAFSDGTCPNCRNGITTACMNGGFFPMNGDGGQGEAVRVPLAETTLVSVPGSGHSDKMMRSLLTLSDVMATGHHAAVCAHVEAGHTVAVVGDGAVGLSGVLAAKRLGAERIIALSRHADRQQLATEFGATDIVAERGDEAVEDDQGDDGRRRRRRDARMRGHRPVDGDRDRDRPRRLDGRLRRRPTRRRAPDRADVPPHGRRPGRRRPRARLPPRTARRRAGREGQPGPGARLRDRPRGHRRCLRRHGRAPRHQVTGPDLMAAWTADDLRRIAAAEELEIAPVRRNGELRRPTPIWVVQAGDDLYVRAAYGANKGWHGVARTSHQAELRTGGVTRRVT